MFLSLELCFLCLAPVLYLLGENIFCNQSHRDILCHMSNLLGSLYSLLFTGVKGLRLQGLRIFSLLEFPWLLALFDGKLLRKVCY